MEIKYLYQLAIQGMTGMFVKYSFMVEYIYFKYYGGVINETRMILKTIPTFITGAQTN
jgi:hypothetical protein